MFEKFNLTNTIREGVDISEMEFKPLADFAGMKIKVEGFYFNNKGFFGEQLVVIGNGYQINMPKRAVKDFKEIANNKTMLNAVLSGTLPHLSFWTRRTSPPSCGRFLRIWG